MEGWRKAAYGKFEDFGVYPRGLPAETNRDVKQYNHNRAIQLAPVTSVVKYIATQAASSELVLEKYEDGKWEVVDENLPDWLNPESQPNKYQSHYDFIFNIACNLLVGGQVGILVTEYKAGRPNQLVTIPANYLNITYRGRRLGRTDYIPGYASAGEVEYFLDDGEYIKPYPDGDLLQIKLMTRDNIVYGESPLMWAAPPLRMALAADAYSEFAITTPWPHGILSTKGRTTPEHIKSLQKQLERVMRSPYKSHLPPITSGDLNFIQTYIRPEELQLLDTRKFAISEVCGLYGVPEALISSPTSRITGSGYRAMLNGYAKGTQIPFNNMIGNSLAVLVEGKYRIRLRPIHLTELDPLEESRVLERLVKAGIITINEARTEIGKTRIEGGDELLLPTSTPEDGGDSDSGKDDGTPDERYEDEE